MEGLMSLQAASYSDLGGFNACSKNNGGCSHLCLMTPLGKKCACQSGYVLQEDQQCVKSEANLLFISGGDINRVLSMKPSNDIAILMAAEVEATAMAYDDEFIYWTSIEEKLISRAPLKSTISDTNRDILIEFGLESPNGIAVDRNAKNIYWTDSALQRIEVARSNGQHRKVLIWDGLDEPMEIVLDTQKSTMYWSSFGSKPKIESARLDGSHRKELVSSIGRSVGLTIDSMSGRLYWTDIDDNSISYTSIDVQGYVNKVVKTSQGLYGLAVFKDHIYWANWNKGTIERANKEDGHGREDVVVNVGQVTHLLTHRDVDADDNAIEAANACAYENGGCNQLCLYDGSKRKCECSSQFEMKNGVCQAHSNFIIFGQRNKFSRLILNDNPTSIPDMMLPILGARDIRSLSYDSTKKQIFWIDYGSKNRKHHHGSSINWAYDNGTMVEKTKWLPSNNDQHPEDDDAHNRFMPHEIEIDSFNNLLFYSDEKTNVITIVPLPKDPNDEFEDIKSLGQLLSNSEDEPRAFSLHPLKAMIFWVNKGTKQIERSSYDGSRRKAVIAKDLNTPIDIHVDAIDNLLFWADVGINYTQVRIERSNLDGSNRTLLVMEKIHAPLVLLTVLDDFVYWAERSTNSIYRINKMTGLNKSIIKSNAHHLSSLISVPSIRYPKNPCLENTDKKCSHMCLPNLYKNEPECTCPHGENLILMTDGETCGPPPTCNTKDEFKCKTSGKCITKNWRCDGNKDCDDFSDEIGCPDCGNNPSLFRCSKNDQCINATSVCDKVAHCQDNSDEVKCCQKDEYFCAADLKCIDREKVCDKINDCSDGTDEWVVECRPDQEPLKDGNDSINGVNIAIIVVGVIVLILLVVFIVFIFYKR